MKARLPVLIFLALWAITGGPAAARDCRVPHLAGKQAIKPLMDEAQFTRDFERLLAFAWEQWRGGRPAAGHGTPTPVP